MAWGDKKRRREEAKKADRDAARFLKNPPKSSPEGKGVCKLCLTKNGHTATCSRVS
jgi:hypothetical protein